ncbi:glucokinase [Laceyella sacchari]|jgi:glucokinase|uniref:ROK family protein n=1 Tax=Laceyella sacchari TaxID=37482 RepID=UPI001051BACF|nr:ROK family protein [Laceyella sacchari]TCW41757.1 glucokinase [Laceyella sacchari]
MKYLVGIDVGGTNIVCGLLDGEGRLLEKIKRPTEAHLGSDHVLEVIAQTVRTLISSRNTDTSQVLAVGVGSPGLVDPEQGITLFAGNLGWHRVEVAKQLSEKLNLPVFADNDVRMYVFGEAITGAGKGYDHVLGITLGTGVGAAVIVRGQVYYGGGFMAGELGHMRMEGEQAACACGMQGCLETVASATGIVRQVRGAVAQGEQSVLGTWFPTANLSGLTAADVSKAYDAGDRVAQEVLDHTGRVLGRALAYAVTLFSPDVVVIGGGVAEAGERLLAPMREELQRSVYQGYWSRLAIRTAYWPDDAGVIGSALYAKQKVEEA